MKTGSIQKITACAMLIAIGIVIPTFSPLKIILEPASFTLASHVAIFIAMFISPLAAAAVAVGTTLGFFLGGFPIVVVMRAATHLLFAVIGALYLQQRRETLESPWKVRVFSALLGILHGASEVAVVCPFYFGGNMSSAFYAQGFVHSVVLLVGVGSVIHSMVDFELSLLLYRVLGKQRSFQALLQTEPTKTSV